ncbi:MAG: hypothetical protein HY275_09515 [Gemmatimonadetes bacterium]|nr:hypothetical protein [Gemmatimonadota bacterium]
MSLATSSDAQEAADTVGRFQFVVSSGALVPTGVQRDAIARGDLTTAQLSYLVRPGVALTSSIGWSRSHDLALAGQRTLDVFTYDVGAEWRGRAWTDGDRWSLMPFAGAGAGGRSYSHRHLGTESTHNLAGYASVGGEVGYARVRLRLEARDYLTGFKALGGVGASGARNDVALLLGLRITGPVQ